MTLSRGRYTLVTMLGQGSFGSVYVADDPLARRKVALKTSLPQPGESPEEQRARFFREAEVLSRLKHPGICAVYDFYHDNAQSVLVMEYIQGKSLQDVIERDGPMPREALADLMRQTLDVLVYLHGREVPVVHRDIKPANLLRTADGRYCLVDFGLARPRGTGQRDTERLGTLEYAAPEQGQGHSQPASDIFAWSGMMLFAATGRPPEGFPAPLPRLGAARPDLPAEWDALLGRCQDPAPERRPSARELLGVVARPPATAPPPTPGSAPHAGSPSATPGGCPCCGDPRPPVHGCCPGCHLGPSLHGSPAEAWIARGEELLDRERPAEAAAHLAHARSMGWRSPALAVSLAAALSRSGRPQEALAVLQGEADSPEVALERARALVRLQRIPEAHSCIGGLASPDARALAIGIGGASPAEQLEQAGRLCREHARATAPRVLLTNLLSRAGRVEEALRIADEGLQAEPGNRRLLRTAAEWSLSAGLDEKCAIYVRRLRREAPDDPRGIFLAARLKARGARHAEARDLLQEYVLLCPSDPQGKRELARPLLSAGATAEAIPLLEELRGNPRTSVEATRILALAWLRVGQASQALSLLAGGPDQQDDPDFCEQVAVELSRLDKPRGAVAWARRALALDPSRAPARAVVDRLQS